MNTQLQVVRQSKFLDRIINNEYVFFKFASKLSHITHIIDAFIKATCKFWSNCLNRDALFSYHLQDKEHLNWCLRCFNLVHRNLGNKSSCTLLIFYKVIYLSGFSNCSKKFLSLIHI